MNNAIIKDLISMGYREIRKNVYAKPVGFHLLIFKLEELIFTNWFKDKNGYMQIWNTSTYKDVDVDVDGIFIEWIKTEESIAVYSKRINSNFEFINPNDILND